MSNLVNWFSCCNNSNAVDWLKSFIRSSDTDTLKKLLRFGTVFDLSSFERDKIVSLDVLPDDVMSKASACVSINFTTKVLE